MWFLYGLTWVSFIFQICFATLSLAAGLYYVAEIIEEFTAVTERYGSLHGFSGNAAQESKVYRGRTT